MPGSFHLVARRADPTWGYLYNHADLARLGYVIRQRDPADHEPALPSVPSVPEKTHAKITPEMTTPEEVDNRQYISVSRRRNMSTLKRRSIPAHGVAFARRTSPVRLALAPCEPSASASPNFVNLSLRRDPSAGRRLREILAVDLRSVQQSWSVRETEIGLRLLDREWAHPVAPILVVASPSPTRVRQRFISSRNLEAAWRATMAKSSPCPA